MQRFGMPVDAILTLGSLYCRCIHGTNRLSGHSFGEAIAIAGLRWRRPGGPASRMDETLVHSYRDPQERAVLRRVKACLRLSFARVIDYHRRDHRDHFHCHLNRGRGRTHDASTWRFVQEALGVVLGRSSPITGNLDAPTRAALEAFAGQPLAAAGRAAIDRFTPEDLDWTARFVLGEAGGRDTPENRVVIWAMFTRHAFFRHRYFRTFRAFLRRYSTPLMSFLPPSRAGDVQDRPDFVWRPEDGYVAPGIERGQTRRHIWIQTAPWSALPESARRLALQALRGRVPNPIGNATDFASTWILFRSKHGRTPTEEEWRRFTEAYKRSDRRRWIGPVPNLDQRTNAFFFVERPVVAGRPDTIPSRLPVGVVRALPP